MSFIIQNQPVNLPMTAEELRSSIKCCTYDDEVEYFIAEALRRGNDDAKMLASKLSGLDVDQAQSYLKAP